MIASILTMDRHAVRSLNLKDPYAVHKLVYDLFPGDRRNFLYYDRGGDNQGRKFLILSEGQPSVSEYGIIESRIVPENFLDHRIYAFQILLNPVERKSGNKRFIPILTRVPLYDWFMRRQEDWGIAAEPESLEIFNLGVQIISAGDREITHNKAEFRGILEVVDRGKFKHSFNYGIGRGKAFGFGLLQLRPLNINK